MSFYEIVLYLIGFGLAAVAFGRVFSKPFRSGSFFTLSDSEKKGGDLDRLILEKKGQLGHLKRSEEVEQSESSARHRGSNQTLETIKDRIKTARGENYNDLRKMEAFVKEAQWSAASAAKKAVTDLKPVVEASGNFPSASVIRELIGLELYWRDSFPETYRALLFRIALDSILDMVLAHIAPIKVRGVYAFTHRGVIAFTVFSKESSLYPLMKAPRPQSVEELDPILQIWRDQYHRQGVSAKDYLAHTDEQPEKFFERFEVWEKMIGPWCPLPECPSAEDETRHWAKQILGLKGDLEIKKIEKCFKKQALVFHPDRLPIEQIPEEERDLARRIAQENYLIVQKARETLKNFIGQAPPAL